MEEQGFGNEMDADDMLIEITHFVDSMMIKFPAAYRRSSTIVLQIEGGAVYGTLSTNKKMIPEKS
jgi:hypothetical protein